MTAPTTEAKLRALHAPSRNKYFYGKLLDAHALQMEQCYGIEKRWLLNRLALGSGVLCGLTVTAGANGTVCISPGVAIDTLGREIIVPAPVVVDPAQPQDCQRGAPGDSLEHGQTTIYLCYKECETDFTSVAVADCDGAASTAAGSVAERYCVMVQAGVPDAEPASLTGAQRDAIFPMQPPADFDRRVAAEESLAITCAVPPDPTCVVLATVTLAGKGVAPTVDQFTYRAEVFSNTVLFELIANLADRVDACCAAVHPVTQTISIKDGDGQAAEVSTQLPAPVTLLVLASDGNPVDAAAVEVSTADADAALSLDGVTWNAALSGPTDAAGVLAVQWRLGTAVGTQSFAAKLTSNGATVTAHASATVAPVAKPPVVVRIDPSNAAQLDSKWGSEPVLTIEFDQNMDPSGYANPDAWLRAWAFRTNADGLFSEGRRMKLAPGDPKEGNGSRFRGNPIDAGSFTVVVMMLGSAPQIVSADTALALDAEFAGTSLTQQQLDQLWPSDPFQPDKDFIARLTDGGGTLPSGDGTPGGKYFHGFFTGSPAQ